eukprot:gene11131-4448_t
MSQHEFQWDKTGAGFGASAVLANAASKQQKALARGSVGGFIFSEGSTEGGEQDENDAKAAAAAKAADYKYKPPFQIAPEYVRGTGVHGGTTSLSSFSHNNAPGFMASARAGIDDGAETARV